MAFDAAAHPVKVRSVVTESKIARWTLILLSLVFLTLILLLPLAAVFVEAFRKGTGAFFEALQDAETFSAIRLTLIVAGISAQSRLRCCRRVVDRQVRIQGQGFPHHADRSALLRLAGHFGSCLRAALRG
jgi:hypothetical protein